jgi:hypothetical protein
LESDRALIKQDTKKRTSSKGDIEVGKIQKSSKKITPVSEEKLE